MIRSVLNGEVTELFTRSRKTLEEVHAKKIEEFNEEKKKMNQHEVVHIEINPQLKKDIERCINKAIIFENRTFDLPFTFAKSLSDDRKVSSTINQLFLYFPSIKEYTSIFLYLENGSPFYIDEYSCMVAVPPKSIWITGGLHHVNRANLSNECYEIDLTKVNLQNHVRLTQRPSFPTKRAFHGCICVKNWLFLCGGTDTIVEKEEDKVLDSCYKINTKGATEWAPMAKMSRVRSFLTLASHKDKYIYAFGGLYMTSKTAFDSIKEIDKYSIEEDKWTLLQYKGKFYEPGQKMAAFSIEGSNKIIIFGGVKIKQYNVGLTHEYEYDCNQDEITSSLQHRVPHSEVFMDKNEVKYGDKIYILASRKRNTVISYDVVKKSWEIVNETINIKKSTNTSHT